MSLLNSILIKLFGSKSEKDRKAVAPIVEQIKAVYPTLETLSNDELRARTQALRASIQEAIKDLQAQKDALKKEADATDCPVDKKESNYKAIDELEKEIDNAVEAKLTEILPEAFAIVKDTARRFAAAETVEVTATDMDRELATTADFVTIEGDKAIYKTTWVAGGLPIKWDMVHYDCQLFGGVVLHQGKIAEMATGEGKTLVATLPVFLNALPGRGVHVVTVNDYLAKRDSEWMGPLYQFHGLTVDCIDKHQPNSAARRKAYACDITFGTNNEFGFDYLRDNGATSPAELVQRKHNYAIVDEVDSVLIDDARTPLIISGPVAQKQDQMFEQFKPYVANLVAEQHKLVTKYLADSKKMMDSTDEKTQEEGALSLFRAYKGLPKNRPLIKFLSEPGIKSKMLKTENYYMQENNKNMHIATDPLYFVIDEKNNTIELTDKGVADLSAALKDSQFFVLPDVGTEMANIEKSDMTDEEKISKKNDLMQDYAIKSERVHTVNQLLKAYTLFEKDQEYVVIDGKVKIVDEQTGRIMEGRRYSDGLHQALEAKESVKVEDPTQTYATITLQNYFRMYHKLSGMTGTAETEAGEFWNIYKLDVVVIPTNRPIARQDKNDLIYKTTKEKFNAVIKEIVRLHEEGRPVLVGTTAVDISEKLSLMLKMQGIQHNVLNAKLHQKEAEIVAKAGQRGAVTIATNMAGRGTDIKLTDEVKALGGLAIIGTERHESRRVDRQLRGRAGRQGDPGSSQFFVSLEDKLMRLFGGEKMIKFMDRFGLQEGEELQNSMLTSSIEKAQRKVEENNFGMRKRLLEYDDVMNSQREVVYTRRRHALFGERLDVDIDNMMQDSAYAQIADAKQADASYESLRLDVLKNFTTQLPFDEDEYHHGKVEDLARKLYDAATESFKLRKQVIVEQAYPVIEQVFTEQGDKYKNIVLPITNGMLTYNILINLKEAYETKGQSLIVNAEKAFLLLTIDDQWRDHLRQMDELRKSVQNATYEQKDPLLIYKFESFNLFKTMIETINRLSVQSMTRLSIPVQARDPEEERRMQEEHRRQMEAELARRRLEVERLRAMREASQSQQQPQQVVSKQKVGRNDPCPCGSGKKYKNCHGKGLEE
ncbi:MAG: preprotein translocase subunit SecA [Bacteroidales bacterium]|nr:preprotein translocase subunit SecA [Bacteroidales bacterium]